MRGGVCETDDVIASFIFGKVFLGNKGTLATRYSFMGRRKDTNRYSLEMYLFNFSPQASTSPRLIRGSTQGKSKEDPDKDRFGQARRSVQPSKKDLDKETPAATPAVRSPQREIKSVSIN